MPIPTLTTPRLVLRAFREADLDTYAAMCADPEVMLHIGSGGPIARDVAWRHMALFCGEWMLHGHGMWAVAERVGGRLVGRVGYLDPPGWPGCEMGWLLGRGDWGKGYAFEATRAAIAYGRDQLGIGELISLIRPENERSIALAERLSAVSDREIEFMGHRARVYRHP
jgi:RimJ/RimL family protein N-acetyltransferase